LIPALTKALRFTAARVAEKDFVVISYSMSLSTDGYIAGPDGRFAWAVPSQELHRIHNKRVAAIDAQLLPTGRAAGLPRKVVSGGRYLHGVASD
jgi:hypothetical protein